MVKVDSPQPPNKEVEKPIDKNIAKPVVPELSKKVLVDAEKTGKPLVIFLGSVKPFKMGENYLTVTSKDNPLGYDMGNKILVVKYDGKDYGAPHYFSENYTAEDLDRFYSGKAVPAVKQSSDTPLDKQQDDVKMGGNVGAIDVSSQEQFDKENTGTVLVDIWAPWCGPCRAMSPIVDRLAGNVKVLKVNYDSAPGIASKYGVSSLPTFLVFKNGKEISRRVGMTSEADLLGMTK